MQECILLVTQRITKYPVLVERIIQNTEGREAPRCPGPAGQGSLSTWRRFDQWIGQIPLAIPYAGYWGFPHKGGAVITVKAGSGSVSVTWVNGLRPGHSWVVQTYLEMTSVSRDQGQESEEPGAVGAEENGGQAVLITPTTHLQRIWPVGMRSSPAAALQQEKPAPGDSRRWRGLTMS